MTTGVGSKSATTAASARSSMGWTPTHQRSIRIRRSCASHRTTQAVSLGSAESTTAATRRTAWLQYHYFDAYPGSFVTNTNPPVTLYGYDQANSFDQIRTSAAAFLNATYKIEPTVTVRGGFRFTRDTLAIRKILCTRGWPRDCHQSITHRISRICGRRQFPMFQARAS